MHTLINHAQNITQFSDDDDIVPSNDLYTVTMRIW